MKLIIMRGIPGSGKSTTARELAGDFGVVLSTDDYWVNGAGEYIFNPAKLGAAHKWNQDRCEEAMDNGTDIIVIDNTNTVQKEWVKYADTADHYGYSVEFAYATSPWWEEISPRIYNKSFTDDDVQVFFEKNNHGVPFNVIKNMMNRFENI